MTRVIEDVNSVERILIDGIEQGSVAVLSLVVVPIFLFRMSPTLALIAIAFVLLRRWQNASMVLAPR